MGAARQQVQALPRRIKLSALELRFLSASHERQAARHCNNGFLSERNGQHIQDPG
jgi:hypothetical protein